MENLILINVTFNETRVAVTENGTLVELYIERKSHPRTVGNIYKGKVGKVVPGMQAAFIDLGLDRSGFISVEDVYEDIFLDLFLEEEESQSQKRRGKFLIQDVLREGQEVLIQVLKESTSGKGAKLSSNIALPGKYLVLLGMADLIGISRRIENEEERKRLTELVKSSKPKGLGFIARTASTGRSEEEIYQDMDNLIRLWDEIKRRAEDQKAPVLVYEEPSLQIRAVRDLITSEIKKIFEKKVWLKSGGYLIIEEAEALTVIDINTGRYLSGDTHEETIFKINTEAASEAARQIRLRNLVGIIVIDFIDMKNRSKKEELFQTFVDALRKDKARSSIQEISSFGVVQMTRQRVRESLLKNLAESCSYCDGIGYVKSKETASYEIIREIKNQIVNPFARKILVRASQNVIKTLEELERDNLKHLEAQFSKDILFEPSDDHDFKHFEVKAQ